MQEFMILPTGMYRSIKQELQSCWQQTGHAGIHDSTNWSIKQELSHAGNKLAMQEFMILPTGMYRSIKQELSHAGNKLAMQEFMILPTGMYRFIKQELSHAGKQTGHAGIHDSTNWYRWSIKQELSHAGNKLAMQEFMILPTGMYGSITGHAGLQSCCYKTNWHAETKEFMILPTMYMYRSIKQRTYSHAGNKLAMQEFMILPTGMYRSIKQNLVMLETNWPCRNS
ncbi:ENO [Mytilus coruscus]|uniref:ENO n=1 Tax=Mytilus coruscus TaxID=42192 RepID=A0A6J8BHN7_MYTCO|nr:ENO [Mytilus coruscus]